MTSLLKIAEYADVKCNLADDPRDCALWTMVHIAALQTIAFESIARSLVRIAGDHENAGSVPDIANSLQFLVLSDRRKED